jgi:hypothetical protein
MTQVIHVKPGVVFKEFNCYTFEFLAALYKCAKRFNCDYTITSANDGKHCKTSFHYRNTAWDIRLHDKTPGHWYVLQAALKVELPPYFDIVIEGIDSEGHATDNLHMHVEADLKKVGSFIIAAGDIAREHAEGVS